MSTITKPERKVTPPPPDNPWYYGWRDIDRTMPDGTTKHEQIPLTLEDALHPEEGDCIMESNLHDLLTNYLASVFRYRVANDPSALVLSDTGVYWDHPELDHHSPDECVIFGIKKPKPVWSSFHVREEGVRPHSIVEIVSPNTRKNDVETKMVEYHMAEVPFYFIFDKKREEDPWTLRGYRWTPNEYAPLPADPQGRMWSEALDLWLAAEGQNIVCYDGKTNERIGDFVENLQRLKEAESALENLKARADAEQRAREAAEAKLKELEAELVRLRGK